MLLLQKTAKLFNCNYTIYRELRKIAKVAEITNNHSGNAQVEQQQQQQQQQSHRQPLQLEQEYHHPEHQKEHTNISTLTIEKKYQRIKNPFTIQLDQESTPLSPLAPIDLNNPPDIVRNFPPTFNFAAYVNQSETLKHLIKLGVDLNRIEKYGERLKFILKLDFEKDMKPHIIFLNDLGIPSNYLGTLITKNPLIFKENLDDLQVRINYLLAKRFQQNHIQRIVTKNPFWLMFSTHRIDRRLGFFQQNFKLSGNEVRFLATKQPRLITYHLENIRKSIFSIREEMGFNDDEIKCLLLAKPKLWMIKMDDLIERFDYIHRVMKISHENIVQSPEILTSREFRIRQRHEFLQILGKAQYDPAKDLYISLKSLIEGTDQEFVVNVAKTDMKTYDTFLRTL